MQAVQWIHLLTHEQLAARDETRDTSAECATQVSAHATLVRASWLTHSFVLLIAHVIQCSVREDAQEGR